MAKLEELSHDELKLLVIKAATMALDLKKKNNSVGRDDVVTYMMTNLKETGKAKFIGIAAASKAIDYKLHKIGSDQEILEKIMKDSNEIIDSILNE